MLKENACRRGCVEWLREPDRRWSPHRQSSWRSIGSTETAAIWSARPLCDRRARFEDIVARSELTFPVCRLPSDGLEACQQVIERGYEGYVAKDEASAYGVGPTRRWLKVNQKDWTVEGDRWRRRISVTPARR